MKVILKHIFVLFLMVVVSSIANSLFKIISFNAPKTDINYTDDSFSNLERNQSDHFAFFSDSDNTEENDTETEIDYNIDVFIGSCISTLTNESLPTTPLKFRQLQFAWSDVVIDISPLPPSQQFA